MLKSIINIQLHLRYIWIRITALVSRETAICCNCGAQHRRRNVDGSFQAFCKEACFESTMRDHKVRDLNGAY